MADFDLLIIGAGVVGLATARAAASMGASVLIAEKASAFGSEISSRNSEVIHAGIYYPPGSHKARLCREGREQLYAYARQRNIGHRRIGKLIVASEEGQRARLAAIRARAEANDVCDLVELGPDEVACLEPALRSAGALLSPSTGIIDSHAFMLALLGDAEALGATLATRSEIVRLRQRVDRSWSVWVDGEQEPVLTVAAVVNATGLSAGEVGRRIEDYPVERIRTLHYAKGNYFAYTGSVPFSRLVYPLPEPGGLGIHLTLDLAGRARFGPDVEWSPRVEYNVDPARRETFAAAIRRYWPAVEIDRLVPDFAGVRPKLAGRDQTDEDFVVEAADQHGLPGLVNLYGIESPGLTSAMPLGRLAALAALEGVQTLKPQKCRLDRTFVA